MAELKSYFIRHKMDITAEATEELCKDNLIAIHFTDYQFTNTKDYLEPERYNTKILPMFNSHEITAVKRAIGTFRELNEKGGYIWAEYFDQIKVGKVIASSFREIRKRRKKASKVYTEEESLLKTLKIECIKKIKPEDAMSLKVCRPPFTTVTEWKAVSNRLECMVEGTPMPKEWGSLFDSEQESICAEFLREKHENSHNLPILKHLLLPVGRTMKDVDIYGVSKDNKQIFGQVFFESEKKSTSKKDKLKGYRGERVFFCDCPNQEIKYNEKDDMWIVPCQIVKKWLMQNEKLLSNYFH
jgi:hypothetical protein